ncbi:rhodanese-like domain-containing protein [Hydrogenimonas sp.]
MTPEEIGDIVHIRPTKEMLEEGSITIVDIRTRSEWIETGIVPGAHCITFFDEFGNYDTEKFLEAYHGIADKETVVGLICRTGNRTRMVANFLRQHGYRALNLDGGVFYLKSIGFELVPYDPNA